MTASTTSAQDLPHSYPTTSTIRDLVETFRHLESGSHADESQTQSIAGRLMSVRAQGRAFFADIVDRDGRIQIFARRGHTDDAVFEMLAGANVGDWFGVSGIPMRTRRGELSIDPTQAQLLARASVSLPNEHDELTLETARTQRYLDLAVSAESREHFAARSRIISRMRRHLEDQGFLEVQTPTLQTTYGGANARPFTTHHNALDRDLFLRVSPEPYLRRLICGGMDRVAEFSSCFRNEGLSATHSPEFSMLELYQAHASYTEMMDRLEALVSAAHAATGRPDQITLPTGEIVDITSPWQRLSVREAIEAQTGLDILSAGLTELADALTAAGGEVEGDITWDSVVAALIEAVVEPSLSGLTILYDYPAASSPFARTRADEPRLAERFEAFVGTMELANAYSEQNNAETLEAQLITNGSHIDQDHLLAMRYGMPPTGGLGIGIDRLVMILTQTHHIRDVILFPVTNARG